MNDTQLALLLFVIVFLPVLYISRWRIQKGGFPDLRPISAFDMLRGVTARAIEAGRAVHVSLGLAGIHSDVTADSLAGLMALKYLAHQSAAAGALPVITMADATLLPLAQDTIRRPFGPDGDEATLAARQVRWIAPEAAAYSAGVMDILGSEAVEATVMIGAFGDEYLLMGEAARRRGITQVGGASDPNVVPFVFASADQALVGEDLYAAGAYLTRNVWHVGSLLAQDFMRWVIVAVIVALVATKTLL